MSEHLETGNNPAPSLANPFAGIISPSFKTLFTNMIDALLMDDSITVPCRLVFAGTQLIDCSNCTSNIYTPGGPVPFPRGMTCPICQGKRIEVFQDFDIQMAVINDAKKWLILSRPQYQNLTAQAPNMLAETLCRIELYPKIMAANYAVLDANNEGYTLNKFMRVGDPELMGLGNHQYMLTAWQRVT